MVVIAVIISVILLITIIIAAFCDINPFLAFLIVAAVFGLGLYLFNKWASKGKSTEREITIDYDVKTNSAKLFKRTGANLNGMSIKEYSNVSAQYNPSKTVFTAATVGGVTTGGFHKTKAHISDVYEGGSGKYYLWVKTPSKTELFENDYMILNKIILTDELAEEAKNDARVKNFLVGNELILKHRNTSGLTAAERDIMKQALNSNDYALQHNISKRAVNDARLSWQECYDIKDWISGDIPQKSNSTPEKTAPETVKENTVKRRKHPSFCTYRNIENLTCTCKKSNNHKKICQSTAGCEFYKDKRD